MRCKPNALSGAAGAKPPKRNWAGDVLSLPKDGWEDKALFCAMGDRC